MRLVFHKPYKSAVEEELADIPEGFLRDPEKTYKARRDALEPLKELCQSAESNGVPIVVISAFRSYERQSELFSEGEARHGKGRGILWLAPQGYSEHHTGYAFDLADRNRPETDDEPSFEDTAAFGWLIHNGGKFGFELSFPKKNWQNIGYEPWHWRFNGNREAKEIFHPRLAGRVLVFFKSILNGIRMKYL